MVKRQLRLEETRFLGLFEDVMGSDGTVHAGTVFSNNVIVADANNSIDVIDIRNLSIRGVILRQDISQM